MDRVYLAFIGRVGGAGGAGRPEGASLLEIPTKLVAACTALDLGNDTPVTSVVERVSRLWHGHQRQIECKGGVRPVARKVPLPCGSSAGVNWSDAVTAHQRQPVAAFDLSEVPGVSVFQCERCCCVVALA